MGYGSCVGLGISLKEGRYWRFVLGLTDWFSGVLVFSFFYIVGVGAVLKAVSESEDIRVLRAAGEG